MKKISDDVDLFLYGQEIRQVYSVAVFYDMEDILLNDAMRYGYHVPGDPDLTIAPERTCLIFDF